MPPKPLKEGGLAFDHMDRLLRLASDPGFTKHLLAGPGWTCMAGSRAPNRTPAAQPRSVGPRAVTTDAPLLTAPFWRSRRSAASRASCLRPAPGSDDDGAHRTVRGQPSGRSSPTQQRRTLIRISLQLVPFAGIAFLWFIGVIRDQLGDVEDRLFSTVFLGSGLLFLAMLFIGAVNASSMTAMLAGPDINADLWAFGRTSTQALISVYAMRMAAVFTLSVTTAGLRTSAFPRWVC